MHGRIAFLRGSAGQALAAEQDCRERPLELVVPYTNPALTAQALEAALKLAQGFDVAVTLVAVHVLPYPAPLECQDGIRERLEAELTAIARTSAAAIRVQLVFARDREQGFLAVLQRKALVVIGTRARWWRSGEQRLARKLSARGHTVAVIRVK